MTHNIKKNPVKIQFPNPRLTKPSTEGLIAIGGDLEVDTLKEAYQLGIYPWPLDARHPLLWFCPDERGIVDFSNIHIPQQLKKVERKSGFHFTFNKAFKEVIDACAEQKRPNQEGTWILPEMIAAYIRFHEAGYAHSIECWNKENQLVGGLYGVFVDGLFSGESMFYREDNASKMCFLKMAKALESFGCAWMDIQMITPVTEQLGGKYISRSAFLDRLDALHAKGPSHKINFPN